MWVRAQCDFGLGHARSRQVSGVYLHLQVLTKRVALVAQTMLAWYRMEDWGVEPLREFENAGPVRRRRSGQRRRARERACVVCVYLCMCVCVYVCTCVCARVPGTRDHANSETSEVCSSMFLQVWRPHVFVRKPLRTSIRLRKDSLHTGLRVYVHRISRSVCSIDVANPPARSYNGGPRPRLR